MKNSIQRKLQVSFGFSLLLLIITGIFSYISILTLLAEQLQGSFA